MDDVTLNLLSEDLDVARKESGRRTNGEEKLIDKINIFETLELTKQDRSLSILEKIEGTTTDQPLINLNESSYEVGEKSKEAASIQSMLDQPGTSDRFKDLKMTQI